MYGATEVGWEAGAEVVRAGGGVEAACELLWALAWAAACRLARFAGELLWTVVVTAAGGVFTVGAIGAG